MSIPMTEAEVTESRRLHAEQERQRSGGRCLVCGYAGMNVVHDPADYRAWSVEHVYRYDYYRDAGVEFHPYEPGPDPVDPNPYRRPSRGRIPTFRR